MTDITPEQIKQLSDLAITNPPAALQTCEEYSRVFTTGLNWAIQQGGFFIDIGAALNEVALVERGIIALQSALQLVPQTQSHYLLYSIGNGYSTLYSIARQGSNFAYNPDTTSLNSANQHYREALQRVENIEPPLLAQIYINYGNSLSHGGRSVEAIAKFDQAIRISNDHPMALGNLGLALLHYAFITRQKDLLHEAQTVLMRALSDDQIERVGESGARKTFEEALNRVNMLLANLQDVQNTPSTKLPHTTEWHKQYSKFCLKYQLLLNLCLPNRQCQHPLEDNVGFSIITDINDETTFPKLSRIANELKERFATARLLLFEAINPPYQTERFDEITHYVNNLDYGVYGLGIGKMKLAFEAAYNALDKIAFFIDAYFNLNSPPQSIDFPSIWYEHKSNTLRGSLLSTNNYHLFGLYSLSRDFAKNAYYGHLRRIRNYTTHRYLIPHVELMGWMENIDGPEYHLTYTQLKDACIELMKVVRSAIIYLISCIDQEERQKHANSSSIIAPIYASRFKPFDLY